MNKEHAHALAMMAAEFAGQSVAGHSDVAQRVADAYIEAYKAVMNIGSPLSWRTPKQG